MKIEDSTIAYTWNMYRQTNLPPDAPEFAVQKCREAFIAGSMTVAMTMDRLLTEPRDRMESIIKLLNDEGMRLELAISNPDGLPS